MAPCRISIGNLAWVVRCTERSHSARTFAFLHPKALAAGKRQWAPLGGGAMLTDVGRQHLEKTFGATCFERENEENPYDLRCIIDDSYVNNLFAHYEQPHSAYEHPPTLDIMHELFEVKWPGVRPLLPLERKDGITSLYSHTARQALANVKTDTSERAKTIPTHRLFRIFDLRMGAELYDMLFSHPMSGNLTASELNTTLGGSVPGHRHNGDVIQNNFFLS